MQYKAMVIAIAFLMLVKDISLMLNQYMFCFYFCVFFCIMCLVNDERNVPIMTMRERIASGKLYTDMCEGLPEDRLRGKELMFEFNNTRPSEEEKRFELMSRMFGKIGRNAWIEPPIHFAYGSNIFIGDNFYANFNFTVVDDYTVTIGDNVLIAPSVTISVTGHPVHHEIRNKGLLYSFPVTIGNNVWIGSNAVINPSVTIGDNTVIGAGSVVTKDIPSNVVAAGVPCKVIREINDRDKEYYYKDFKVE